MEDLICKTAAELVAERNELQSKLCWKKTIGMAGFVVGMGFLIAGMVLTGTDFTNEIRIHQAPVALSLLLGFIIFFGGGVLASSNVSEMEEALRDAQPATSAECSLLEPFTYQPAMVDYIQQVVRLGRNLTLGEVNYWLAWCKRDEQRKKCRKVYGVPEYGAEAEALVNHPHLSVQRKLPNHVGACEGENLSKPD